MGRYNAEMEEERVRRYFGLGRVKIERNSLSMFEIGFNFKDSNLDPQD